VTLAPSPSYPAGVKALFELGELAGSPFPSDVYTVPDDRQITSLRINLPKPDCAVRASDCEDIELLNELDGFNLQPRLSIPFSGPIDPSTITRDTVFLLPVAGGSRIGINQVVWDVETSTLHVESEELLAQHTDYALVVTREILDTAGDPLEASGPFQAFRHGRKLGHREDDARLPAYREALLAALDAAARDGVDLNRVAVASVFTTMSVTAPMQKIRDQIRASPPPAAANFLLGIGGVRTVFPLSAISAIRVDEHTGFGLTGPTFVQFLPRLAQLRLIPNAVGTLAFGSYRAPMYLDGQQFIPQAGTRTGVPVVQREEEVVFNLFLPAVTPTRSRPALGWPIAIYMTGCCEGDNKNGTPFNIAANLANQGIAAVSIDPVGAGRGPLSRTTVSLAGVASVQFPSGGRGIDVDGDGDIEAGEGNDTTGVRRIVFGRDTRRQSAADLMQLIRVIEAGMDVDGDGVADIDASRIYYVGFSHGSTSAPPLLVVEPRIRAAVLTAPNALLTERLRLSPGNRSILGELLASRQPALTNVADPSGIAFDENLPLRGVAPVLNTVSGAMAIQELFERMEWLYMPADAAAFAPYLRKAPLPGAAETPIILQIAKGDQTGPNPGAFAIVRAGGLADRTTFFRNDIAVQSYGAGPPAPPPTPPPGVEVNPHNFMVRLNSPTRSAIAFAAQRQIATFFASDGLVTLDPNVGLATNPPPLAPLYETPIQGPIPEGLNFIETPP
jgi:hypothetical protein